MKLLVIAFVVVMLSSYAFSQSVMPLPKKNRYSRAKIMLNDSTNILCKDFWIVGNQISYKSKVSEKLLIVNLDNVNSITVLENDYKMLGFGVGIVLGAVLATPNLAEERFTTYLSKVVLGGVLGYLIASIFTTNKTYHRVGNVEYVPAVK